MMVYTVHIIQGGKPHRESRATYLALVNRMILINREKFTTTTVYMKRLFQSGVCADEDLVNPARSH